MGASERSAAVSRSPRARSWLATTYGMRASVVADVYAANIPTAATATRKPPNTARPPGTGRRRPMKRGRGGGGGGARAGGAPQRPRASARRTRAGRAGAAARGGGGGGVGLPRVARRCDRDRLPAAVGPDDGRGGRGGRRPRRRPPRRGAPLRSQAVEHPPRSPRRAARVGLRGVPVGGGRTPGPPRPGHGGGPGRVPG